MKLCDEALQGWEQKVKAIYEEAVGWVHQGLDPHLSPRQHQLERETHQHAFEQQLMAVCQPYLNRAVLQQTDVVNALNAFYQNCLSLSRCQEFLRTILSRNAVFALS